MENNTPHIHSFKDTLVPSTCKERGYTLHKCDCGYEHKDSFQPLSGHNFEPVEGTEPDCTNGGNQRVVCSACGKEVNTTLPPLGHNFGAWNVIELPTCTQDGVQERYCGICGTKEMQAIAATGHKLTKPVKSQTKKGYVECYCENCGETFEKKPMAKKIIITVIILLLVAVAGVFASIKFFIPHYHYVTAKKLLEKGDYAAAYSHFYDCIDYKDSKKFMYNFLFENVEYDYHGYSYDEDGEQKSDYSYGIKHNYVYNANGYSIQHTSIDDLGIETSYIYKREYYDNGKQKSCITYKNGELESTIKYNTNGDVTHSYDANGELKYTYSYEYDSNGYILKRTTYNANGELEYTYSYEYNSHGDIFKQITYNAEGVETERTVHKYEYDNNGNMLSHTYEQTRNKQKYKNEYDVNGIPVKYIFYNEDGEISVKGPVKVEFNENGFEFVVTYYDKDGNIESKCNESYSYPAGYRED